MAHIASPAMVAGAAGAAVRAPGRGGARQQLVGVSGHGAECRRLCRWQSLGPALVLSVAARLKHLKRPKVLCRQSGPTSSKLQVAKTSGPQGQMPFWLACCLALLAGASVTLQVGATMVLNATPAPRLPHAIYVTVWNLLSGGVWLLILAWLQGGPAPKKPERAWSMLGGLMLAPGFVCTPAAALLGTQMTLTLLLTGMMSAAFLFDFWASRLRITKPWLLGMVLLLSAVAMQASLSFGEVHGSNLAKLVGYSLAAAGVGATYTFQAKMNKRLARDLGSTSRSAAFCNLSVVLWGLPACIVLVRSGVPLYLRASDWWLWLFAGLQSAFYTFSLAKLPKMLGYSLCFILVSTGKLCTAAFADTVGLFGEPLVVSPWRYISVAATLLGAVAFTFNRAPSRSH